MPIINTRCPTGPYKWRECFAIFGVDYWIYLILILISLIIGFVSYLVYLKIKKAEFETKKYAIKSLVISLIVFLILSLIIIFQQATIIY